MVTIHRRGAIHLVGLSRYAAGAGGDTVHNLISELRPKAVLAESIHAAEVSVAPGGEVPYRRLLAPAGAHVAAELVTSPDFRQKWSAEAVAVLSALRVDAPVVFADRYHTTSFSRLIARRSLDALRHELIAVVEAAAKHIETTPPAAAPAMGAPAGGAPGPGAAVTPGALLPQNFVAPFFPELWTERHVLMGHFARQQQQATNGDVVVIVGADHADALAGHLDEDGGGAVDAGVEAAVVTDLLADFANDENDADELEKRAAVAALLVCTQSFPPDAVLPPAEQLGDDARAAVGRVWSKYRGAFSDRLEHAMRRRPPPDPGSGSGRSEAPPQQPPRVGGLAQLAELCDRIVSGAGGGDNTTS